MQLVSFCGRSALSPSSAAAARDARRRHAQRCLVCGRMRVACASPHFAANSAVITSRAPPDSLRGVARRSGRASPMDTPGSAGGCASAPRRGAKAPRCARELRAARGAHAAAALACARRALASSCRVGAATPVGGRSCAMRVGNAWRKTHGPRRCQLRLPRRCQRIPMVRATSFTGYASATRLSGSEKRAAPALPVQTATT